MSLAFCISFAGVGWRTHWSIFQFVLPIAHWCFNWPSLNAVDSYKSIRFLSLSSAFSFLYFFYFYFFFFYFWRVCVSALQYHHWKCTNESFTSQPNTPLYVELYRMRLYGRLEVSLNRRWSRRGHLKHSNGKNVWGRIIFFFFWKLNW